MREASAERDGSSSSSVSEVGAIAMVKCTMREVLCAGIDARVGREGGTQLPVLRQRRTCPQLFRSKGGGAEGICEEVPQPDSGSIELPLQWGLQRSPTLLFVHYFPCYGAGLLWLAVALEPCKACLLRSHDVSSALSLMTYPSGVFLEDTAGLCFMDVATTNLEDGQSAHPGG